MGFPHLASVFFTEPERVYNRPPLVKDSKTFEAQRINRCYMFAMKCSQLKRRPLSATRLLIMFAAGVASSIHNQRESRAVMTSRSTKHTYTHTSHSLTACLLHAGLPAELTSPVNVSSFLISSWRATRLAHANILHLTTIIIFSEE
jgi:hypothetical protein